MANTMQKSLFLSGLKLHWKTVRQYLSQTCLIPLPYKRDFTTIKEREK